MVCIESDFCFTQSSKAFAGSNRLKQLYDENKEPDLYDI
jgi:hypothetical protein